MDAVLDNLDQRLRGIDGALRLRWNEAGGPWPLRWPDEERGPADVLRLRWHLDEGGETATD